MRKFIAKVKNSKAGKYVFTACAVSAICMFSVISVFAEGTSNPNDQAAAVSAAQTVLSSVTSVLNISSIAAILAAGVGFAAGLFLAWWGVRYLSRMTVNAFSKGKLKI